MKNCKACYQGTVTAPEYNTASSCEQPPTQLRTVVIPKNKGGDGVGEPYEPKLGAFQNTLVIYRKSGSVYVYDASGVYTNLTGTDYAAQIIEMAEKLQEHSDTLTSLSDALATETATRTREDASLREQLGSLSSALATETTQRTEADSNMMSQIEQMNKQLNDISGVVEGDLSSINDKVDQFEQLLQQEASIRGDKDTELENKLNQTADKLDALEGVFDGAGTLSRNVLIAAEADADVSTVTLNFTEGPLNQTETTISEVPLPVASITQAGVINAATYKAFQNNADAVDAILNGAVSLGTIPANPSQDQLTTAWKEATGKSDLVNRASIYDSANGLVWYYYENVGQWQSMQAAGEFSIATATNNSLGIVMGSTADGMIAVEQNGTMSVNGWDTYTAKVDNNAVQIAALNVTIGNIQSVLTRLDSGAGV